MVEPKAGRSPGKTRRFGLILAFAAVSLFLVLKLTGRTRRPSEAEERPPAPKDTVQSVISIAAVGDVMLEAGALPLIRKNGIDYPFIATRSILEAADIAVANLEAPFARSGKPFQKQFTFRVPPEFCMGLKNAGFDVLTLANNHILDYGPKALFSTLDLLDSLGFVRCGAGRNLDEAQKEGVIVRPGWKIAFLAYSMTYPEEFWATSVNCGTAFPRKAEMQKRIAEVKGLSDLVVVSFHWGKERADFPEPYERDFARLAVDSGADLVIGHHPHVLQGFELYRGRPIAYSLGNFAFGSYTETCREGAILKAFFSRNGFIRAEIVPVSVYNSEVQFQPKVLAGERKDKVLAFIGRVSKRLNGGKDIVSAGGEICPDQPGKGTENDR
jgi:poly-gamma-glutamate capsule biosynthesis protein CapA/YwtB (metallophosphatase superfamily)